MEDQLIQKSEEYAKEKNCLISVVSIMDFQSVDFHQKCGYKIMYVEIGCAKATKSYYLKKILG